MNKAISIGILSASIVTAPGWACVAPPIRLQHYDVTGMAYDPGGELLYVERLIHRSDSTGGNMETVYSLPNSTEIAKKEVIYNCRPTTPDYRLVDLISGQSEGVEWTGEGVRSYRNGESVILGPPDSPAIFDAGFDNAIKLNWEKLFEGEAVKFQYLFARENRFIPLRIKRASVPSDLEDEAGDQTVFFKISANNLLYRLLSESLFVGYDNDSRSLRYYSGPSNLPMMRNQKQVLIRYIDSNQLDTG